MDADMKRVQDGGEEEMGDINSEASSGGGGVNNRDQIGNIEKTKLGNNPIKKNMNQVDDSELSSSSVSSSSTSSPASSPAAWKAVQGEWYGDRIEIIVGSGDVYLQFEDENEDDDPFFSY
jgi:hypothetical protein